MIILLQIVLGLAILGVLVVIHELGHFIMAKTWGIRVLAFSIGFGKPLFKKTIGETEYRISSIPFGGYVHMAGEHPEDMVASTEKGSDGEELKQEVKTVQPGDFNSKPTWQRALVAIAGPLANLVFAMLFLLATFLLGIDKPVFLKRPVIGAVADSSAAFKAGFSAGDSIVTINGKSMTSWEDIQSILSSQSKEYSVDLMRASQKKTILFSMQKITGGAIPKQPTGGLFSSYPAVIGALTLASPAQKAGLKPGDLVVSINSASIYSWPQLSEIIVHYDSLSHGLLVVVNRAGSLVNATIVPEYKKDAKRYLIGIAPQSPPTEKVRYAFPQALEKTFKKSWEYTTMIFDVMAKLVSKQVPVQQLAGPVGIIQMSGIVAMGGVVAVLDFMALIGINLAVLNIFPLVITDGGLLLFLIIETIRRKPLSIKTQMLINKVAISFFIVLFLFVTYNDILRIPELLRLGK